MLYHDGSPLQDKQAERAYEGAVSVDEGCSEAHFQLGSLLQVSLSFDCWS